MSGVLIVAEMREGQLFGGSLAAVTFAQQLSKLEGGHYDILVQGPGSRQAADALAVYGARKVVFDDSSALSHYLAAPYAQSVAAAAKALGSTWVAAVATTFGKDLLPRAAVRLGAGMVSEAVGVVGQEGGKVVFKRPMFAGNVLAHVVCQTPVGVVTIRGTEFDKPEQQSSRSPVESFQGGAAESPAQRFVSVQKTESARPDLTEARVVVSGGRGLKDGPNFYQVMEPLADALGAAIGASRAAVDAGFCPNDLQVGQTGKVVAPELYIGVAISGAIQHLAGMKASKTIVSINKDKEAPIFAISDYGLVADAFKAVPEFVSQVKNR
jgi:electron transfer flavoprotein alpha subunit